MPSRPPPSLPVTADTTVDDLMSAYTRVIPVFLHRGMMCVGCPVARLHDVREACGEHGVALDDFLLEVNTVIGR